MKLSKEEMKQVFGGTQVGSGTTECTTTCKDGKPISITCAGSCTAVKEVSVQCDKEIIYCSDTKSIGSNVVASLSTSTILRKI